MPECIDSVAVSIGHRACRRNRIVPAREFDSDRTAWQQRLVVKRLERRNRGSSAYARNRQQTALRQLRREQRKGVLTDSAEYNRSRDWLNLLTNQRHQWRIGRDSGH